MSILSHLKSPSIVFAAIMLTSGVAHADDFTFSFTGPGPDGGVSGTVTGIIYGLTNNTASAATEVVITSFPADLVSIYPAGPIDATTWDQQFANSFTEIDGQITDADFIAENTYEGLGYGSQLYINGSSSGYNFLNIDGEDESYVWADSGLSNVTFTPYTPVSATPEPSSLVLLATGLAGAAGTLRRRFRKQ
jgi:PEP-CTERM motif